MSRMGFMIMIILWLYVIIVYLHAYCTHGFVPYSEMLVFVNSTHWCWALCFLQAIAIVLGFLVFVALIILLVFAVKTRSQIRRWGRDRILWEEVKVISDGPHNSIGEWVSICLCVCMCVCVANLSGMSSCQQKPGYTQIMTGRRASDKFYSALNQILRSCRHFLGEDSKFSSRQFILNLPEHQSISLSAIINTWCAAKQCWNPHGFEFQFKDKKKTDKKTHKDTKIHSVRDTFTAE